MKSDRAIRSMLYTHLAKALLLSNYSGTEYLGIGIPLSNKTAVCHSLSWCTNVVTPKYLLGRIHTHTHIYSTQAMMKPQPFLFRFLLSKTGKLNKL